MSNAHFTPLVEKMKHFITKGTYFNFYSRIIDFFKNLRTFSVYNLINHNFSLKQFLRKINSIGICKKLVFLSFKKNNNNYVN